jgi:Ser/Thr protein kinase RdoA (MazF antagonist)
MEKLEVILNEFQAPDLDYNFEVLSNGFINDTYMVSLNNEGRYILQRVNTNVFSNIHALIFNLELVLPVLKSVEYQEVKIIKSKIGNSFFENKKGEVWRLMTFVKNSLVYNTTRNNDIAFEVGKIIGLFHELTKSIDIYKLKETLPNFHKLSFRYDQFQEAMLHANSDKILKAKKAIDFVKNNISVLLSIPIDELPIRTCHNDTKLNNILFNKSDKALCLIDLDTIMKGSFLYDFGDAVRTTVNSAKEDEKDLAKINFSLEMFESMVEGLSLYGKVLTKKEKELLALGVILMPFLHGLRALTDYLENNRYYKVSYDNQNLDRCLSLFTFAHLAIKNQKNMEAIIREKLNK